MLCQSLGGGATTITEHEAGAISRSTSAGGRTRYVVVVLCKQGRRREGGDVVGKRHM